MAQSNWHPSQSYDFELMIGGTDYSTDLQRLQITSGINVPYQHIFLDIFVDSRDILTEKLFGQEPIKLIIRETGKGQSYYGGEILYNFNLMYINTEGDFTTVQTNFDTDQWERSIVRLKTIPINAYRTMTTMVNKIFFDKTPEDIIRDIAGSLSSIVYDPQGKSSLLIDQMLIPPTTIYNIIQYIDRTYGVFNGPLAAHCTFENKLKIQNLAMKVRDAQKFTLYLIASNKDETKVIESEEPTVFYTKKPLGFSYEGNSTFASKAPKSVYIVKPRDTISEKIPVDLEDFTKNYGIMEPNNPKIYFNKDAIRASQRIITKKDQTGYDLDETFINANLSSAIKEMSVTVATIEGNLPILALMDVGEHVKIVSHVDTQLQLGGAYILKSSTMQFIKSQQWEALAIVHMIRSNIAQQ